MITLALRNLRQNKFRSLLAALSVAIGTAALILFLGINNGIQSATFEELEKSSPLTQITVRPNAENTGLLGLFTDREGLKLTNEDLNKIKEIDGVIAIHPETQFNSFASIEAGLLGFTLVTDTMIFGVPQEFIQDDLQKPEFWNQTTEPLPTIIPRKLLDIYNFSIASPQGLPLLSEKNLIGKDLKLFPNHSNFFPGLSNKEDPIELEVIGFSDKANLVGITLSDKNVTELNKKFANTDSEHFIEFFVETENPGITTQIANKIEALGYSTQYFQKNIQSIESKFTYLTASLGIISAIILLTAAIAIISTFLATVAERTKELGLFRALGATKGQIKTLILIEALAIGIIGTIAGILIGWISSKLIDIFGLEALSTATFTPESLFKIDLPLILTTIFFGLTLSLLSAYPPAKKASNVDPIEALNK